MVLSNISVVTWYSSGSSSDVKGRGLEGINDIVFCDAGQVIVVEKRALETSSVNFSQDHLKEMKETRADILVKVLFKICIPKIIECEILEPSMASVNILNHLFLLTWDINSYLHETWLELLNRMLMYLSSAKGTINNDQTPASILLQWLYPAATPSANELKINRMMDH